jgi:nitrogen fixation protein FixH
LAAGPAIVVVASFVTMAIAATHDDGLVAADYYKLGLTINRRLAAAPQTLHEVAATLTIAHDGAVRVRLDEEPKIVTLSLRPVGVHAPPMAVALRRTAPGEWTGTVDPIAPGRMTATIEADGTPLPVTLVETLPATVRVHAALPSG